MGFIVTMLVYAAAAQLCASDRINFTSCQNAEWSCANNVPNDIVYTCSLIRSNNFIIHLKDYYTDYIRSVTVQNCKNLKVVLDCPILQRSSQLQRFRVKDCDKLDFIALARDSLLQTPPELQIENVKEIASIPRGLFKSPSSNTEQKCTGSASLKGLRIKNSRITSINTRAIYNVSGARYIEFENVTVMYIQSQAIEALMSGNGPVFKLVNSNVNNLGTRAITAQSTTAVVSDNVLGDVAASAFNITSDYLHFRRNNVREISANGLVLQAPNIDIINNRIHTLKTNAFAGVRCLRKSSMRKYFNFIKNKIENVEPYSFVFNYASCKLANAQVTFSENAIDCRCRNIGFLHSASPTSNELFATIMNVANNNTCISAPCVLPVEVVKILVESRMCSLTLDPQVICLLYNDRVSSENEVTTDEEMTEPEPTFYLIRQANSPNREVSDMTSINKDELLNSRNFNVTNRTTIKFVFDSSKDFVETLRGVSAPRNRPADASRTTLRNEYVNRCAGAHCRDNVAYDRQKALDFYKYVYAQLRTPRQNDKRINN